jgi:glucose/arabinose dehydrogenase
MKGTMKRILTRRISIFLITGAVLGIWFGQQSAPGALANPAQDWPGVGTNLVAGGFQSPLHVTHAGDGSGRLFVVEQRGTIQILQAGVLRDEPFLDISGQVRSPESGGGGEEGLLSVVFPPGFGSGKDHFYVYYTRTDGDNQVSRFRIGEGPNQADPDSEEEILRIPHPGAANHNGGQLAFGPDGYLYIGTGDGGVDSRADAQKLDSLLGKVLRIDVEAGFVPGPAGDHILYFPLVFSDGSAAPDDRAYWIPPSNPYAGNASYREEIWAAGLRNPWRFAFDRQTGDLFIGDVGQTSREEVNHQPASSSGGENYGWPIYEGDHCFQSTSCDDSGLTRPVAVYSTHVQGSCAVTGGYVYHGQDFPALQGIYFFGDYCNGTIWGLQQVSGSWENEALGSTGLWISSFGEDEEGELYLLDHSGGGLYQLVEANR